MSFDIVGDDTDDPVATIAFSVPQGLLKFMAEVEVKGRTLVLRGMHVQGSQANAVGGHNLRLLAEVVMERMDFDGLIVEGAIRTTGSNPGRRPRKLRFTR